MVPFEKLSARYDYVVDSLVESLIRMENGEVNYVGKIEIYFFYEGGIIFCYIFFLNQFLYCQSNTSDSLEHKYNKEAIWFNYPFYYKDGNRIHYSELRNEFSFSPKARLEYELGIKKIKSGRIFSYAAIAVSTASIFGYWQEQELWAWDVCWCFNY